ncbi:hypothetical protein J437_LFUL007954 [Ladona fulva]|uniref:GRF-type domain-containing protein n=1 Tax=Ladona fulva TaxID=123851 RepID=A0A8K0KFL7_LADFU|nr:hypothetical protein J437_LFUL007954 [Ladona fulva]
MTISSQKEIINVGHLSVFLPISHPIKFLFLKVKGIITVLSAKDGCPKKISIAISAKLAPQRCVKPTWTHCGTCNRCCLPHHKCGLKPPAPSACYCGSLNHARKDCPIFPVSSAGSVVLKRKRRPTLLFSRTLKEGKERSFYACSACRDRKECSFFRWADEVSAETNKSNNNVCHPSRDLAKHIERISKLHELIDKKRAYCHTCKCLFNLKRKEKHKNHQVVEGVSNDQMRNPSKFLKPLQCSKKEAQFMFSDKTIKLICDVLTGIDVTFVLCIGTPRIHEYILEECKDKMSSLLLDIDERYVSNLL